MSITQLSRGPASPGTSGTLVVMLVADLVLALWCATQEVARAWGYDHRLGVPLIAMSPTTARLAFAAAARSSIHAAPGGGVRECRG